MELTHKAKSAILDAAVDTGIITLDPRGLVRSWNAEAGRLLGWTEDEMLGQTVERLFTEADRELGVLEAELRDALALGRGGQQGWRIVRMASGYGSSAKPLQSTTAIAGLRQIVREPTE